MTLQAGSFIRSTAALADTVFADAIIFITEHNSSGAVGFVLNKPFGRSLHELEEFKWSRHFVLYNGGPVDGEHLYFLHRRPDVVGNATSVEDGIFFGGDFKQAVAGINSGKLTANDIKIFVGYCGWNVGELEAEIAEGSWTLAKAAADAVFE